MAAVTVYWCDTHHPADDEDYVRCSLEAGGDEGPLLAVPTSARGRPRGSSETPAIFEDVDHYISHLAIHRDDLEDDRYVALVREGHRSTERQSSLAALRAIQQTIAPGTDGIPVKRLRRREEIFLDHMVIPAATITDCPVEIEFAGDALSDVLDAWPKLKNLGASLDNDDRRDAEW